MPPRQRLDVVVLNYAPHQTAAERLESSHYEFGGTF
jgi:hypothetical protein